ncbi:MAG TPA: GMC family oxidoreductase N-terminal domain-containing protein [Kofleriaceae bacterium]|nr:GMC family oxidoreductase N-terminal domain-containing protein [Kofleriaceae bacterium]
MFDYAIIGAGSAGCVLANRLSKDPALRVALVEAGPAGKHRSFGVRAPGLYQTLWWGALDWHLTTEPQPHVDDRRLYWPRGKLVGGTSCLNAMVYIRGHHDNYDAWRDLGNPGWGWSDVLPYFKRSEDSARGASEYHGAGGELPVGDCHEPSDVARAFVAATAARCGVRVTDDFNGADQEGAGIYQHTVKRGMRGDTASAFLDPIRGRANLTIISDALAVGLVVANERVTGVRLRVRGSEQTIEAREVVLAGGAIGSPQLLMLSGIGPADELRAAGIAPIHELAGVGKHLQDHLLVPVMYETRGGPALSRLGLVSSIARHLARKVGPLATSPVEAGAFVRSRPDQPRPDIQFHFTPYGLTPPNTDVKRALPWGRLAMLLPGLIYPKSHGEIRLASSDPAAPPAIDPKYLSDPADLEHLVDGVLLAREVANTAPLAELLGPERLPGPDVTTRDGVRAAVRRSVNTIFHPVGTCKMGSDAMAVVDAELRVRGLAGLRIADASIMPDIIGGNTNAPVIMIAEKAADLMLARR